MTLALPSTDTTDVLAAALAYAARGWRVVPLRPDTRTPCFGDWPILATTDPGRIRAGWDVTDRNGRPYHVGFEGNLVGIVTGEESGIWVLDVDVKDDAGGAESLVDLEASYGTIPGTVEAITGTKGRHLYFAWPQGLTEHLGNSAGKIAPGIDVRAWHGYVVAPPSVNQKTGIAYEWELDYHPDDYAPAPAPEWLVQLAANASRQAPANTPAATPEERSERFDAATLAWDRFNWAPGAAAEVERMLTAAGWQPNGRDRDGTLYLTRPGKDVREGASATLGKVAPGVLWCFTSSAAPFEAERSYDPADVYALLLHGGDRAAADAQLVAAGWGAKSWSIPPAEIAEWVAQASAKNPAPAEVEDVPTHLPDEFWAERPVLAHIRQASRSRLVAADAVLGSILTRVAAITSHSVELPPIVGKPVGLSFYVGAVGGSSAGKSTASGVARELLPIPTEREPVVLDELPIGSGEGFIETLFEMVTEPDPATGKPKTIKRQTRFGAIFNIDEGTVLAELSGRSGSTIMSTLRTAYTHGKLGQANASVERKRELRGGSYVYGVTMGIQPEKAGPLLSDTAAGTPQRFLWLMATDPTVPDEDEPWPGVIGWRPPRPDEVDAYNVGLRDNYYRYQLPVDSAIRAEIRLSRRLDLRGESRRDEADAHRNLVRLKAAALLALLEQRFEVTLDDWRLAGMLVDTSRAVRRSVERALHAEETARTRAAGKKQAAKEAVVRESAESRAAGRASKSIARLVRRHAEEATHAGQGCTRGCLTRAVSSRDRPLVDIDELAETCTAEGWIAPTGGRFIPGGSVPA